MVVALRTPGVGSLAAGRPVPGFVPEVVHIAAAAARGLSAVATPVEELEVGEDLSDQDSGAPPPLQPGGDAGAIPGRSAAVVGGASFESGRPLLAWAMASQQEAPRRGALCYDIPGGRACC